MICRMFKRLSLLNYSHNLSFATLATSGENNQRNPFFGLSISELNKLIYSTQNKTGTFLLYIINAINFKQPYKKDHLRRNLKISADENALVNRCLQQINKLILKNFQPTEIYSFVKFFIDGINNRGFKVDRISLLQFISMIDKLLTQELEKPIHDSQRLEIYKQVTLKLIETKKYINASVKLISKIIKENKLNQKDSFQFLFKLSEMHQNHNMNLFFIIIDLMEHVFQKKFALNEEFLKIMWKMYCKYGYFFNYQGMSQREMFQKIKKITFKKIVNNQIKDKFIFMSQWISIINQQDLYQERITENKQIARYFYDSILNHQIPQQEVTEQSLIHNKDVIKFIHLFQKFLLINTQLIPESQSLKTIQEKVRSKNLQILQKFIEIKQFSYDITRTYLQFWISSFTNIQQIPKPLLKKILKNFIKLVHFLLNNDEFSTILYIRFFEILAKNYAIDNNYDQQTFQEIKQLFKIADVKSIDYFPYEIIRVYHASQILKIQMPFTRDLYQHFQYKEEAILIQNISRTILNEFYQDKLFQIIERSIKKYEKLNHTRQYIDFVRMIIVSLKMGYKKNEVSNKFKELWIIKHKDILVKVMSSSKNFQYSARFLYKQEYIMKNSELELFLDIVFFILQENNDKISQTLNNFIDILLQYSKIDNIMLNYSTFIIQIKLITLLIYKINEKERKLGYNQVMGYIKYLIMTTKKNKISMYESYMIEIIKQFIKLVSPCYKNENILVIHRNSLKIWEDNNVKEFIFEDHRQSRQIQKQINLFLSKTSEFTENQQFYLLDYVEHQKYCFNFIQKSNNNCIQFFKKIKSITVRVNQNHLNSIYRLYNLKKYDLDQNEREDMKSWFIKQVHFISQEQYPDYEALCLEYCTFQKQLIEKENIINYVKRKIQNIEISVFDTLYYTDMTNLSEELIEFIKNIETNSLDKNIFVKKIQKITIAMFLNNVLGVVLRQNQSQCLELFIQNFIDKILRSCSFQASQINEVKRSNILIHCIIAKQRTQSPQCHELLDQIISKFSKNTQIINIIALKQRQLLKFVKMRPNEQLIPLYRSGDKHIYFHNGESSENISCEVHFDVMYLRKKYPQLSIQVRTLQFLHPC